jgi:hypothetical protein
MEAAPGCEKKISTPSAPSGTRQPIGDAAKYLLAKELFGGPDRDRTDDLFHAMEARSQLRHRPTKGRTSFILLEHV